METRFGAEQAQDERGASRLSPIVDTGRTGASPAPIVVAAERVSKSFAGVKALYDVDFDLRHGEVHALMGENGAGKSTLMKILAGVHTDYDGAITIEGRSVTFAGVRDAEEAGVAIIHQELNLVPELSVVDNIFLGREPLIAGLLIDRRRMIRAGARLFSASASGSPRKDVSPNCASASSNWWRSPRHCRSMPVS
jgi:ribose transport system ATP-binding protein